MNYNIELYLKEVYKGSEVIQVRPDQRTYTLKLKADIKHKILGLIPVYNYDEHVVTFNRRDFKNLTLNLTTPDTVVKNYAHIAVYFDEEYNTVFWSYHL